MQPSKMRLKSYLCLLNLTITILLAGCWDQRPIEELAIIIGLGVDVNEQNPNLIDVTLGYPLFSELSRSSVKIVTVSGPTFGVATDIWQASNSLVYAGGKVRLVVVGEEIAKRGMPGFLNFIELAKTDDNAIMAVVQGRAEQLLVEGKVLENERTATYTAELIATAHDQGYSVRSEVYDVLTAYASAGIDPIMPLLRLSTGKDSIDVIGSALFTDLIMSGELTLEETQLLLAMLGRLPTVLFSPALGVTGELYSPQPEIQLLSPRAKLRPTVEDEKLTLEVDFRCSYHLRNYYGNADMTKSDTTEEVTKDLESNLNLAIQKLLAKLQAARSDPLGIGRKLRVKNNREYDDNAFREMWEQATLDITVDMHYVRDGTLTQTELKKP